MDYAHLLSCPPSAYPSTFLGFAYLIIHKLKSNNFLYHELSISFSFCLITRILIIIDFEKQPLFKDYSRSDLGYVVKLKSTDNKHLYKICSKNGVA